MVEVSPQVSSSSFLLINPKSQSTSHVCSSTAQFFLAQIVPHSSVYKLSLGIKNAATQNTWYVCFTSCLWVIWKWTETTSLTHSWGAFTLLVHLPSLNQSKIEYFGSFTSWIGLISHNETNQKTSLVRNMAKEKGKQIFSKCKEKS